MKIFPGHKNIIRYIKKMLSVCFSGVFLRNLCTNKGLRFLYKNKKENDADDAFAINKFYINYTLTQRVTIRE